AIVILLAAVSAVVLVAAHTRVAENSRLDPVLKSSDATSESQSQGVQRHRNISFQPEAFKLSRRLGRRFANSGRAVSSLVGTLTVGTETQAVTIVRRQTDRGERVEIARAGGLALLTWSESEGARASSGVPTEAEHNLIERLALDSADQFVLAQLRGASYQIIARNVRPAETAGSDNYNGPIWTVVRVGEPEQDAQRRPRSRWRLYYINEATGLIDKILSEVGDQKIETNFVAWMNQSGERVPSHIIWKYSDQVLMEFRLLTFAHNPQ
ncbi:MAG TPA: hypothetical protein VJM12_17295, partial [Pyrinomonadaceae bacterium]|nr:hypothetical protein [Pyrinomonadaceae bacterium]